MAAIKRSSVSKTIIASGNYNDNDVVSEGETNGTGTAWRFLNIGFGSGIPGMIFKADMTCDADAVVASFRLHLFSDAITASELDDNSALALDDDDRANYLGYIDFPALQDFGEYSASQATGLSFGYWCGQTSNDLFGILQITDAETNEAANMVITVNLYAVSSQ